MNTQNNIKFRQFYHAIPLGLCLVALAGCSSSEIHNGIEQSKSYQQAHPIRVEEQNKRLVINVYPGGFEISHQEEARIKSFMYGFADRGNGKVKISIPSGTENAGSTRAAARHIADIIEMTGIQQKDITIATFEGHPGESPPISIEYQEFVAIAPDCRDMWDENLADAYHNTRWKGLGCTTRANLAAMLVNPRDLLEMPALAPGMGARRAEVIDRFVTGTTTSATRAAEETISSGDI